MDDPLFDLLSRVAVQIGESGDIREFGVSRILHLPSSGRNFEIGIGGNSVWVNHDLVWEVLPAGVEIAYAPDGSYTRSALVSEKVGYIRTGDQAFDATFMVLGEPEASIPFSEALTPEVRQTFLAYKDLKQSIQHFEVMTGRTSPMEDRLHVHALLQLENGSPVSRPPAALQIAGFASRLRAFVLTLEARL